MWIEFTFIAELHREKLAVQTCHIFCADSGSDPHVMLTCDFVTGGKSVNILGPINGLAMSNLGKANFGMAFFALKTFLVPLKKTFASRSGLAQLPELLRNMSEVFASAIC